MLFSAVVINYMIGILIEKTHNPTIVTPLDEADLMVVKHNMMN